MVKKLALILATFVLIILASIKAEIIIYSKVLTIITNIFLLFKTINNLSSLKW